ncbi:MAG: Smr/MutS family protein [Ginsengibacter sp.]
MKYQPGDRILLLHSQEEGEVVELINDKMVMVEVDKIRFPVYMDQIDFPYFKRFTEKKIVEQKKEKKYIDNVKTEKATPKNLFSTGVWLSFLPVFDKDIFDDDVVESFKIYLLNQTGDGYFFSYRLKFAGNSDFELKNQVPPFTDFYLHDVLFEEMNDAPKIELEFSLLNPSKTRAESFESSLKLKGKQLFQKIESMKLKNEPTFAYKLFEIYPDKLDLVAPDYNYSGGLMYDASKPQQYLEPARSMIDLHIEKLTDSWKHLSNFEILTLQLKHFEKYYYLAVAHHLPGLIVVHGIGTGKLKEEVHEILKTKKEVKSFINQYHTSYGYGATEIFFDYK